MPQPPKRRRKQPHPARRKPSVTYKFNSSNPRKQKAQETQEPDPDFDADLFMPGGGFFEQLDNTHSYLMPYPYQSLYNTMLDRVMGPPHTRNPYTIRPPEAPPLIIRRARPRANKAQRIDG